MDKVRELEYRCVRRPCDGDPSMVHVTMSLIASGTAGTAAGDFVVLWDGDLLAEDVDELGKQTESAWRFAVEWGPNMARDMGLKGLGNA